MANEEHLKILRRGVAAWNAWMDKHRSAEPPLRGPDLGGAYLRDVDLSKANLSFADLSDADLIHARLSQADLHGARLSGATLNMADLSFANLVEVDFRGAKLIRVHFRDSRLSFANFNLANLRSATLEYADLGGTNLADADLGGALLRRASLVGAHLGGADFSLARIDGAIFADVDLRDVKGLETVIHQGPSEISISTIYRSEGKIPEVFLRGCGVPESLIVQIPALIGAMQPIQFYSCFISYSSKDEELAQRLYADLQSKGVRCWFAPKDMKIGDRIRSRIDDVIRVYDRLMLILSEHSVASSWVGKEVETAMESEDEQHRPVLFPVRLDDAVMEIKTGWPADVRRTRHIGDFRRWKEHDEYQKAFARLLADLKASA